MTSNLEVDWAWLAGLVDGEGCIRITKQKRQKADGGTRLEYQLALLITSTTKLLVDEAQRITESGFIYKYKPNKSRRSETWTWAIQTKTATDVLMKMYPYLRYKKPQADIAFEFQQTVLPYGHKLTDEIIRKRDELRSKLMSLHQ